MNELFDLPATAPDRLSAARKRYEAADAACTQAELDQEELGVSARNATIEYNRAVAELAAAERERMTP